jgi:hypothetical protein
MSKGSDMLLDAARTLAERGRVYGEARANMERTAQLWSIVLGVPVTPVQVALCLVQLKVARLLVTPDHSDSAVDIAGYAAVLCEAQKDV